MLFSSIVSVSNDSIQAGSDTIHDELKLVLKTNAGELVCLKKDISDQKSHCQLDSISVSN